MVALSSIVRPLADAWQRSPLRKRVDALAPRERLLIGVCLAALGAALLYSLATSLVGFRSDALARYARERGDLEWMQANRGAAVAARRAGSGAPEPGAAISTISAAARDVGLPLRRIQPEASGISVQVEAQPFAKVIGWTSDLETTHGVQIVNARIDRHDDGVVNARFTLR